jgi:MFS family permease
LTFRTSISTLVSNRNLLSLTLAQSLTMLAMFLWRPYWGLYILELGGTPSILGALSTLQAASTLLLQLPGGLLADRYGRRRIILVAAAAGLLPPIIFRLSTHWTMLIPGIIASSLSSIALPARNALISESLPPENRATGFGAYTMVTYVFIVASYPFGGYILDLMGVISGIHLGLVISFIAVVPSVLIQWRYLTETLNPDHVERGDEPGKVWSLSRLKEAPPGIWLLILVAILSSLSFQLFWSFVVIYCTETLGLSKMQWSLASIAANLIAAAFMVPSGFLSDRARRKPYILLSQFLVSSASLGYIVSPGFPGIVVTRIVGGVGEGLGGNVMGSQSGPVWQALVADVAPAHLRGSVLGLVGTVTGLVSTPAPLVGGYLYENLSPEAPFFASFLLGMLGLVIFTLFVKEPDDRM